MLLFDGCGSHLTREVLSYMEANKIIPFCLLPHSTHLCQPLDVGVFQPFKHWHTEAIDKAMRQANGDYTRIDFLANFQVVHDQAFKQSTIKSAWEKTGLIPYNPSIVLDRLARIQQKFS